jgi:hypothetical protein
MRDLVVLVGDLGDRRRRATSRPPADFKMPPAINRNVVLSALEDVAATHRAGDGESSGASRRM